MREHLCIAVIGRIKDRTHASVGDYCERVQRCHDLDMCLEVGNAQGTHAQNATAEARSEEAEFAMGIGVHAGESVIAPGYFGRGLGSTDVQQLEAVLSDGSDPASRRAWAHDSGAGEAEHVRGLLRDAPASTRLAPIHIGQHTVIGPVQIYPATMRLCDIRGEVISVSQRVKAQGSPGQALKPNTVRIDDNLHPVVPADPWRHTRQEAHVSPVGRGNRGDPGTSRAPGACRGHRGLHGMSIRRALYAFPRLGVSRRVRQESLMYRSMVGPKTACTFIGAYLSQHRLQGSLLMV
jgi:hypothetical protein